MPTRRRSGKPVPIGHSHSAQPASGNEIRMSHQPRTRAPTAITMPAMSSDPHNIDIQAAARYLADQSDPDDDRFVFAYTIRLQNRGEQAAQLISRHWVITDGNGKVEEVKGDGVVGKQPVLEPGQSFEYSSGAVIETAVGSMRGSYQMQAEDGTHFDASIPTFTLSVPRMLN